MIKENDLRAMAEAKIATQEAISAATSGRMGATRLFHELQVHQVELEMQNEELQAAYRNLAQREELHHAILQTAMDGFWLLDAKGCLLEVNEAYCRMSGYLAEELLGTLAAQRESAGSENDTAARLHLVKTQGTDRFETQHHHKEGSNIDVEISVRFLPVGDGWYAVFLRDITERKWAGEQLKKLALERDMANKELEAFNYTVAHDLRQPLNVIYGFSHLIDALCSEQLGEDCKGYVKEINNSVVRMNCIINALLKFASSGQVAPCRKMVDLSAMALEVGATLRLTGLERNVEFVVADRVVAHADADLLRVVLDNLLSNAWKFTATRPEAIIEFGVIDTAGKPVYFVRDNGVGFAAASAAQLFAPFQRLSDNGEFKGFGIGLATVDRIIRCHGGKIWAEGEVDAGATFYFTLAAD